MHFSKASQYTHLQSYPSEQIPSEGTHLVDYEILSCLFRHFEITR